MTESTAAPDTDEAVEPADTIETRVAALDTLKTRLADALATSGVVSDHNAAADAVHGELAAVTDGLLDGFFDDTHYTFDAARTRYRGVPVPNCHLCGGPLTIGSMGGGNATVYACANAGYSKDKKYDSEHYAASRYTHTNPGDTLAYLLMEFAAALTGRRPTDG